VKAHAVLRGDEVELPLGLALEGLRGREDGGVDARGLRLREIVDEGCDGLPAPLQQRMVARLDEVDAP
jgi:hypothetical protein